MDELTRWWPSIVTALTSPADPLPFMPAAPSLRDVTVWQRVRLRRGGRRLRLTFSNEFGAEPITLSAVRVQARDASRHATVEGDARWDIPPGGVLTGDPVELPTADDADVMVAAHVVDAGPATFLHSAQSTAHLAAGDHVDGAPPGDAATTTSAYWLAQVAVDAPPAAAVVAIGDSLTRGDRTTPDADQRYPDHLQRRLRDDGMGAVVLNAGIGGNRLLSGRVGPALLARLDRDAFGVAGITDLIVSAGLNDLGLADFLGERRPTADELCAGLLEVGTRAHRRGVRALIATLTPCAGSTVPSFRAAETLATRDEVNRRLRAQTTWPVVDFASAVANPADPTRVRADLDSGDGVHVNDAGAAALAAAVDLARLAARI